MATLKDAQTRLCAKLAGIFIQVWFGGSESLECATKSKKHHQAQRRSNLFSQTTFLLFI